MFARNEVCLFYYFVFLVMCVKLYVFLVGFCRFNMAFRITVPDKYPAESVR